MVMGFHGRWQVRWLLVNGRLGDAFVQSVEPSRSGKRKAWKIYLRCKGAGDKPLSYIRFRPEQVQLFRARLASQQPVFLLFNPAKPKLAIFPEALVW